MMHQTNNISQSQPYIVRITTFNSNIHRYKEFPVFGDINTAKIEAMRTFITTSGATRCSVFTSSGKQESLTKEEEVASFDGEDCISWNKVVSNRTKESVDVD